MLKIMLKINVKSNKINKYGLIPFRSCLFNYAFASLFRMYSLHTFYIQGIILGTNVYSSTLRNPSLMGKHNRLLTKWSENNVTNGTKEEAVDVIVQGKEEEAYTIWGNTGFREKIFCQGLNKCVKICQAEN